MLKNRKLAMIAGGAALLLLTIGGIWYFTSGSSSQVAHVRQLRDQLFSEKSKDLTPEQRKESFGEFRKEMEKLSPKERSEVFADRQKKMEQKLDKFFKLTPEQQEEQLDKDIDELQEKGKRWLERAGKGGGFPFGGGGPGGQTTGAPGGPGGGSPGVPGGSSPGGSTSASTPTAGPGGSGGPGGPGGFGRGRTQEQRDQFRKNMLDGTSPEFRAQMSEYRRQFGNRMQQRGISFGGFGFGGGPR